ncbi:hypothetical protein, partial [Klebsiella pneumoniae]
ASCSRELRITRRLRLNGAPPAEEQNERVSGRTHPSGKGKATTAAAGGFGEGRESLKAFAAVAMGYGSAEISTADREGLRQYS